MVENNSRQMWESGNRTFQNLCKAAKVDQRVKFILRGLSSGNKNQINSLITSIEYLDKEEQS